MSPVQVNCPECQKLFMVDTESLANGQARFQCTGCEGYFAFNWPQPPETSMVRAQPLDAKDFAQAPVPPVAAATVNTLIEKVTQECFRCNEKCDVHFTECPRCGVLFDRVKTIKPKASVVAPAGPEVLKAWEQVRAQYIDDRKHENFIQICLNRDNLAFASSQYRGILEANPNDDIALRMQNRIVELATASYVASTPAKFNTFAPGKLRLTGLMLSLGAVFILVGFAMPMARSLIAIGCAMLVFVYTLKHSNG